MKEGNFTKIFSRIKDGDRVNKYDKIKGIKVEYEGKKYYCSYTCTSVPEEKMKKYGILPIGKKIADDLDNREVLLVPVDELENYFGDSLAETDIALKIENYLVNVKRMRIK